MRYFLLILVLSGVALVTVTGLRGAKSTRPPIEIFPDMDRQPKVKKQTESAFFADGRSARPPVADTVPIGYNFPSKPIAGQPVPEGFYRGFTDGTDYLDTGKFDGGNWGSGIPVPVTKELILRGQQRFQINCAVCHGATGGGNGITTQYGLVGVVNLQDKRIRDMADGQIYNTIVHGKNTMMPYGDKLNIRDRWAIVSYIRALQRSQNAVLVDVPAEKQKELEAGK
ncbi:MAG TPA: cytochrome c [Chthoniobacterales bacterium]